MTVEDIYRNLKNDLQLCIKYHRRNRPEMVEEYFGTTKWEEIEKQLDVICKPFSLIQKIQIERVIADLHTFYLLQPNEDGGTKESHGGENQRAGMEEQPKELGDYGLVEEGDSNKTSGRKKGRTNQKGRGRNSGRKTSKKED